MSLRIKIAPAAGTRASARAEDFESHTVGCDVYTDASSRSATATDVLPVAPMPTLPERMIVMFVALNFTIDEV